MGYQPCLILAVPCVKYCNREKSPTGTHSGPVWVGGALAVPPSVRPKTTKLQKCWSWAIECSHSNTNQLIHRCPLFSLPLPRLVLSPSLLLRTVWLELSPHWNPVRLQSMQGTQGPISVELLEKMSRFSNIVKISMILGFFWSSLRQNAVRREG